MLVYCNRVLKASAFERSSNASSATKNFEHDHVLGCETTQRIFKSVGRVLCRELFGMSRRKGMCLETTCFETNVAPPFANTTCGSFTALPQIVVETNCTTFWISAHGSLDSAWCNAGALLIFPFGFAFAPRTPFAFVRRLIVKLRLLVVAQGCISA